MTLTLYLFILLAFSQSLCLMTGNHIQAKYNSSFEHNNKKGKKKKNKCSLFVGYIIQKYCSFIIHLLTTVFHK